MQRPSSALQVKSKRRMHDVGFKLHHCYTLENGVPVLTSCQSFGLHGIFKCQEPFYAQVNECHTIHQKRLSTVQYSAVQCITKVENLDVSSSRTHNPGKGLNQSPSSETLRNHVSHTK